MGKPHGVQISFQWLPSQSAATLTLIPSINFTPSVARDGSRKRPLSFEFGLSMCPGLLIQRNKRVFKGGHRKNRKLFGKQWDTAGNYKILLDGEWESMCPKDDKVKKWTQKLQSPEMNT